MNIFYLFIEFDDLISYNQNVLVCARWGKEGENQEYIAHYTKVLIVILFTLFVSEFQ